MIEPDRTTRPVTHYDVACDDCSPGEARVEAANFYEAVQAIKAAGWSVSKRGGEWRHRCPDCVADRDAAREPGGML